MNLFRNFFGLCKKKPKKDSQETKPVDCAVHTAEQRLEELKEFFLIENGKAYEISQDGKTLDYFPNINRLTKEHPMFKTSTVYIAINKKGTYSKNNFVIKEWLRS